MYEPGREPETRSEDGLAALVRALSAGLADLVVDGRDVELVDAVREVEALGRHVDALRVRLAGEVAHRSRRELGSERLAARHGCRSAVELLQRLTGVSGTTASHRQRLGLAVRPDTGLTGSPVPARFAHVAHALASGALALDAAQAIVRALEPTRRVATTEDVRAAEAELVAAAIGDAPPDMTADGDPSDDDDPIDGAGEKGGPRRRRVPALDADSVRAQAQLWAEYLDPDGAAPDDRDAERRFVTLHAARHGLVPVSGLLLPEVAAALRRYADACTNPRTAPLADPAADGESGRGLCGTPDGDAAPLPGRQIDPRSRAQLLHDVLATVVTVAARVVDAPSVAGNAPTLVVVAREDDLEAGHGTARAEDGAPISIAAARQIGCAGAIQRVSVGKSGRVLGIWAPDRCFTGPQRRAIAMRDRGCVIPGCHVPVAWCEVHHVTPHADDPGGTHTDNGVLLCWHHHRTLDSSGWAIRMLDGVPWTRPPAWLDPAGRWTRHSAGPPLRGTA